MRVRAYVRKRKTIKKWNVTERIERGRGLGIRRNYRDGVGCLTFNWAIHRWVFVYSTERIIGSRVFATGPALKRREARIRIIASNWKFPRNFRNLATFELTAVISLRRPVYQWERSAKCDGKKFFVIRLETRCWLTFTDPSRRDSLLICSFNRTDISKTSTDVKLQNNCSFN